MTLVIFCGSGATAAVNKPIGILELRIPAGLNGRYDLSREGRVALGGAEIWRPLSLAGTVSHADDINRTSVCAGPADPADIVVLSA